MYATVTLTGTYQMVDGSPATGTIEIIPSVRQIIDATGNVILSGRKKVILDELGGFSVDLPATDDTSLNPTGFGYTVAARLHHQHLAAVSLQLPAGTSPVDIANVTTVDPATFEPTASYASTAEVEELDTRVTTVETGVSAKADAASLSPVATSGAYADLTGLPAIPDSADDIGAETPAGAQAKADAAQTAAQTYADTVSSAASDDAVAAIVSDPTTATADVLSSTYALKGEAGAGATDKGDGLMAALDQKRDAVVALLGDSTGNEADEWLYLWAAHEATRYPSALVNYRLYDGSGYPAPTVVSAGGGGGDIFRDTFTRSGELVGSTPDVGGTWTGPTGIYALDGSKANFIGGTAGSTAMRASVAQPGRMTASLTWTIITDASGGNSEWKTVSSYVDSGNFLWIRIKTANAEIELKDGATVLATHPFADAGITAASATPQTVDVSIAHVGDQVTFTVGTLSETFTLAPADDTMYAGASMVGFWGDGSTDHSVDNLVATGSAPPPMTLDLYNGSVGSTRADYPLTRIAEMLPVEPDAVVLSYSHNHTTETPATFEAALDALVSEIRGTYPDAPIIISGQNPQYPPTANPDEHNARQADLRRYARANGYGYLPAFEAFMSQDDPQAFIESDGVHPNPSGSQLWADAGAAYFDALSLKP